MKEVTMDLQPFWQLRASDTAPVSIRREFINYFLDGLAAKFDVPIEVHLDSVETNHVYIRWRTQKTHAGLLGLALDGFFSIRLGQETPKVEASLFLFSGEHKLFPPPALQGYLDLMYEPQQGWREVSWYMDDLEEFDDKRYSGATPEYSPVVIPEGSSESIIPTLLQERFGQAITITPGEPSRFTSKEPLFGVLAISFAGEIQQLDEHSHSFEVTIRLQTGDQPLAVGQRAQPELVLQLQSADGVAWDYAWKEHSKG